MDGIFQLNMTANSEENFSRVAKSLGLVQLKPFQKSVISSILEEKCDVFVCAKTGSGKSACFQGLVNYYMNRCETESNNAIVVVISPLLSLMESQVNELQKHGISATYIGREESERYNIWKGKFNYVYSNPENLTTGIWRNLLKCQVYKDNLICIVFDEVHTAVAWGLEKDGEPAFRPEFANVGELRALAPECPLLALTATASSSVRTKLLQMLSMKDPLQIIESPDRENIKISVSKISGDPVESFKWLTEKLNSNKEQCDKYIIYCRRISDCSSLYSFFRDEVVDTSLFEMFHSRTINKIKQRILESISDSQSRIRVLIATNAVGMGLNFDCKYVINYGPPSDYDAYLQQIGRVGRDGTKSQAMLVYHGQQLRKLSPEMLSFVKFQDQCRRVNLRKLYGDKSGNKDVKGCSCCDICEIDCDCGACHENEVQFKISSQSRPETVMERYVSEEDTDKLEVHLLALKNELDKCPPLYSPLISHGLSLQVIKSILSESKYIFDIDTLLDKCGVFHEATAARILQVFSAVFGDTDLEMDFVEDTFPAV